MFFTVEFAWSGKISHRKADLLSRTRPMPSKTLLLQPLPPPAHATRIVILRSLSLRQRVAERRLCLVTSLPAYSFLVPSGAQCTPQIRSYYSYVNALCYGVFTPYPPPPKDLPDGQTTYAASRWWSVKQQPSVMSERMVVRPLIEKDAPVVRRLGRSQKIAYPPPWLLPARGADGSAAGGASAAVKIESNHR